MKRFLEVTGRGPCAGQVPAPLNSEGVAQRELNLALVVRQSAVDPGAPIRASLIGIIAGSRELGMVENVEHFSTELKIVPFRDFKILEGGEIEVHLVRA